MTELSRSPLLPIAALNSRSTGGRTDLRFIDWIWTIRGRISLPPGQSGEDGLDHLEPLFDAAGTSHERIGDTLTFRKKDAVAQDKMSVFDTGVLRVESGAMGPELGYRLSSRILLFCFLLPFLFVGLGQLTVVIGEMDKPTAVEKAKKKAEKARIAALPLNPIDKFLGAPAPDKPKKDDEKAKKKKAEDDGPSGKTAYVFGGIFASLFAVGRLLEDRMIKSLFRKHLWGSSS